MRVLVLVLLACVVGCQAAVAPITNTEFLGAAEESDDQPTELDFTQLHRLSNALQNFNFPDGANKITVWRQGGGKGISTTTSSDELSLTLAINGISGKDMDLSNVAVISDGGRSVRFVDYKTQQDKKLPEIKVKRGDVVALMLPQ